MTGRAMLSRAFLSLVANMVSFLRKEIQAAVREEVPGTVMNSSGTATNSTSTLSTGATVAENSHNSRIWLQVPFNKAVQNALIVQTMTKFVICALSSNKQNLVKNFIQ